MSDTQNATHCGACNNGVEFVFVHGGQTHCIKSVVKCCEEHSKGKIDTWTFKIDPTIQPAAEEFGHSALVRELLQNKDGTMNTSLQLSGSEISEGLVLERIMLPEDTVKDIITRMLRTFPSGKHNAMGLRTKTWQNEDIEVNGTATPVRLQQGGSTKIMGYNWENISPSMFTSKETRNLIRMFANAIADGIEGTNNPYRSQDSTHIFLKQGATDGNKHTETGGQAALNYGLPFFPGWSKSFADLQTHDIWTVFTGPISMYAEFSIHALLDQTTGSDDLRDMKDIAWIRAKLADVNSGLKMGWVLQTTGMLARSMELYKDDQGIVHFTAHAVSRGIKHTENNEATTNDMNEDRGASVSLWRQGNNKLFGHITDMFTRSYFKAIPAENWTRYPGPWPHWIADTFFGNSLPTELLKGMQLHSIINEWEKTRRLEDIQIVAERLYPGHPCNRTYLNFIQGIYLEYKGAMQILETTRIKGMTHVPRHEELIDKKLTTEESPLFSCDHCSQTTPYGYYVILKRQQNDPEGRMTESSFTSECRSCTKRLTREEIVGHERMVHGQNITCTNKKCTTNHCATNDHQCIATAAAQELQCKICPKDAPAATTGYFENGNHLIEHLKDKHPQNTGNVEEDYRTKGQKNELYCVNQKCTGQCMKQACFATMATITDQPSGKPDKTESTIICAPCIASTLSPMPKAIDLMLPKSLVSNMIKLTLGGDGTWLGVSKSPSSNFKPITDYAEKTQEETKTICTALMKQLQEKLPELRLTQDSRIEVIRILKNAKNAKLLQNQRECEPHVDARCAGQAIVVISLVVQGTNGRPGTYKVTLGPEWRINNSFDIGGGQAYCLQGTNRYATWHKFHIPDNITQRTTFILGINEVQDNANDAFKFPHELQDPFAFMIRNPEFNHFNTTDDDERQMDKMHKEYDDHRSKERNYRYAQLSSARMHTADTPNVPANRTMQELSTTEQTNLRKEEKRQKTADKKKLNTGKKQKLLSDNTDQAIAESVDLSRQLKNEIDAIMNTGFLGLPNFKKDRDGYGNLCMLIQALFVIRLSYDTKDTASQGIQNLLKKSRKVQEMMNHLGGDKRMETQQLHTAIWESVGDIKWDANTTHDIEGAISTLVGGNNCPVGNHTKINATRTGGCDENTETTLREFPIATTGDTVKWESGNHWIKSMFEFTSTTNCWNCKQRHLWITDELPISFLGTLAWRGLVARGEILQPFHAKDSWILPAFAILVGTSRNVFEPGRSESPLATQQCNGHSVGVVISGDGNNFIINDHAVTRSRTFLQERKGMIVAIMAYTAKGVKSSKPTYPEIHAKVCAQFETAPQS